MSDVASEASSDEPNIGSSALQTDDGLVRPPVVFYVAPPPLYSVGTMERIVEDEIRRVFGSEADRAIAIAKCESGLRPEAINDNPRTGDLSYGVMQINMIGQMGANRRERFGITNIDLFDPYINIQVAFVLSKEGQEFSPWSCNKKI